MYSCILKISGRDVQLKNEPLIHHFQFFPKYIIKIPYSFFLVCLFFFFLSEKTSISFLFRSMEDENGSGKRRIFLVFGLVFDMFYFIVIKKTV